MKDYFEWDTNKAESNYSKHGIKFELAVEIFDDPYGLSEQDRVENGEERWKTLGMATAKAWLLMVAYTMRFDSDGCEIVRIISARRATKAERRLYEHGKV